MNNLNLGNSIFEGFNSKHGVMLCGYEWGSSKADQALLKGAQHKRLGVAHVFSNKALEYGEVAKSWAYDRRIIKWFEIWGHPLSQDDTGGEFEKCIVQTNWCDDENHHVEGSYDVKLLNPLQVANFVKHLQALKPSVIIFLGTQLLRLLQHPSVLGQVEAVLGKCYAEPSIVLKPFVGKRFKVGFQKFEHAEVVCLPHASGSRGLSDDYIALFSEEIGAILNAFKAHRSRGAQPWGIAAAMDVR